jgi:hypothetical protein
MVDCVYMLESIRVELRVLSSFAVPVKLPENVAVVIIDLLFPAFPVTLCSEYFLTDHAAATVDLAAH